MGSSHSNTGGSSTKDDIKTFFKRDHKCSKKDNKIDKKKNRNNYKAANDIARLDTFDYSGYGPDQDYPIANDTGGDCHGGDHDGGHCDAGDYGGDGGGGDFGGDCGGDFGGDCGGCDD